MITKELYQECKKLWDTGEDLHNMEIEVPFEVTLTGSIPINLTSELEDIVVSEGEKFLSKERLEQLLRKAISGEIIDLVRSEILSDNVMCSSYKINNIPTKPTYWKGNFIDFNDLPEINYDNLEIK